MKVSKGYILLISSKSLVTYSSPFILRLGIWTRNLKTKTNLHQTVITRSLKNLESKQLIKAIKSVKVSQAQKLGTSDMNNKLSDGSLGNLTTEFIVLDYCIGSNS